MDSKNARLIDLAHELAEAGDAAGTTIRALGGVAVALFGAPQYGPARPVNDLDVVVPAKHRRLAERALQAAGLAPEARFNAVQGHKRQIWWLPGRCGHVDLFLGKFEMCHTLDLEDRLGFDHPALNPTDLLLTKLQIVELNRKDVVDLVEILGRHQLGQDDGAHLLSEARLCDVLGRDWGFHTTVTQNLGRLPDLARSLDVPHSRALGAQTGELGELLRDCAKTRAFKARARVGKRLRWYREPEETLPSEDAHG